MASTILGQNDLGSGRRNIVQPLPTPTTTFTPTPYVRPSDWTALPTVAETSYVTGIYAVYNQESNFVAFGAGAGGASSAAGAISGTIFSRLAANNLQVNQLVYGTGVAANTIINSVKSCSIAGSIANSGLLTVTTHSGDPLVVGSVFFANFTYRFITGFVSGTGGVGTYTYSGGNTFSAIDPGSYYATVSVSQTVGNFTTATTVVLGTVGQFQVDWGDGSPIEISPGNQVQHNYVYSSVPGVVSSRGYKTAAITITAYNPFGATLNLSAANFDVRYTPGVGQGFINAYVSRWLDMRINIIGTNSFTVSGFNAPLNMLEQVRVDTTGGSAVSFNSKFSGLKLFQNLILDPSIVVTSYSNCFNNTGLISGPSLSSTNTSSATQINGMFQNCTNLTYCPDYNFASCLVASTMFSGCQALVQSPALFNPGVTSSLLTDINSMFNACAQLVKVTPFPTNNVSGGGFNSMFSGCGSLRTENLPLFNTALATNIAGMFSGCSSLTTIPLLNTSNVTDFNQAFFNCSALIQVPLLDTSNATSTPSMFQGCTALQTIPQFNTSKVTNMTSMFQTTTSLITIPLLNTSNVGLFNSTFQSSGIQNIPLLNTINANNMTSMFQSTGKLVTIPLLNTSNVLNMTSMFNQSNVQSIPLLNTINVTTTASMFQSSRVQTVPNLNTGNVTIMASMFNGCSTLATAPTFTDTSKVTQVNSMFQNCNRLNSIPTYNLANTTLFQNMCNGANNLVSFSAINVGSQATVNCASMFTGAVALVNVSNINLGNVTALANTLSFSSTSSLTSLSNVSNARFGFSVASSDFGRLDLQNVFQNVIIANTTAPTITIGFNPGADTANSKTSGTTAGSNVITMANTVSVLAGTYLYGTGVNTGIPVTFDATADTVVYTNGGGVNGLVNGDNVMFTTITTTTGIVINTPYFVVNNTGTTFQISTTSGGVAINLTNNGTGVMSIGGATISNQVVTVNANANVIINGVCGVTNASATLTNRALNQNYATTKNWVVSG